VFLLTDGEPNIHPPRGEIPMLQQFKTKNGLPCSVSTFGFGYKLDSVLLDKLATEGNGNYAFIPDSSLTGTIFVNALSNTLSTFATDLTVNLETDKVGRVFGKFPSDGTSFNLGPLNYGQRRDFVIDLQNSPPPKSIKIEYNRTTGEHEQQVLSNYTQSSNQEALIQSFRLRLTEHLTDPLHPPTQKDLDELQTLGQTPVQNNYVQDLLKDITGEITLALGGEAYKRWGRHFLPSIGRAHLLQQCNNFKDPGVQHYGGKLFRNLRDLADDLFCQLPPPTPSLREKKIAQAQAQQAQSQSQKTPYQTPASPKTGKTPKVKKVKMTKYHNQHGGCIWSDCEVLMADNSLTKVKNLRKGDLVRTPSGESAKILCITKTTLNQLHKNPLVILDGGLILTPWHPVFLNNQWKFPCHIGKCWESSTSQVVFNFVLEKGHIMIVNGVQCVTLGHGFTENVVSHSYFGTQVVINDLKTLPGWENGFIDLNSVTTRRNTDGLVSGYLIN